MTQAQPLSADLSAAPVFEPAVSFAGGDLRSIFSIARTVDQVVQAWRVVYESYLQGGLINPNPVGLHTVPQALHSDSVVVVGEEGGRPRATLTVMRDGPNGLPLDRIYMPELDTLRIQGRRLFEVGLLADLRVQVGRSTAASFGMMCVAFYRALHEDGVIVIGVHPRHAAFYSRMMSFEIIGPESVHPTVNHRPVVLMKLDPSAVLQLQKQPRLVRFFADNSVEQAFFEDRCCFEFPEQISDSPIERFLQLHRHPTAMPS